MRVDLYARGSWRDDATPGQSVQVLILRPATALDGAFLGEMLAVAADWSSATPRSAAEIMSEPALAHYIAGWRREGDHGLVGTERSSPLGAAWWRFFTTTDPGYGFVDSSIPEISMGVVLQARRRGLGRRLLNELVQQGRDQALPGLSLSVSPHNHAASLYRRSGFQVVGTSGESLTMLLRLDA